MRTATFAIAACCCLLLVASGVVARPQWPERIPNGDVFSCSACHTETMDVKQFGLDFLATNPDDPLWTPALAAMDSDGDTFSNGVELQDPDGTWTLGDPDPGVPDLTSNPGDDNSVAIEAVTWGKIKELYSDD